MGTLSGLQHSTLVGLAPLGPPYFSATETRIIGKRLVKRRGRMIGVVGIIVVQEEKERGLVVPIEPGQPATGDLLGGAAVVLATLLVKMAVVGLEALVQAKPHPKGNRPRKPRSESWRCGVSWPASHCRLAHLEITGADDNHRWCVRHAWAGSCPSSWNCATATSWGRKPAPVRTTRPRAPLRRCWASTCAHSRSSLADRHGR